MLNGIGDAGCANGVNVQHAEGWQWHCLDRVGCLSRQQALEWILLPRARMDVAISR